MSLIYKLAPASLWQAAEKAGRFTGSLADIADGYIHFSSAGQLAETAARYFAGQGDLVLAAIDTEKLDVGLRWEPSRGGALFPHLYAPLDLAAVVWVKPVPLDASGHHVLPDLGR